MAFRPSMDELRAAIERTCNEAVLALQRVPKLSSFLETRDAPASSEEASCGGQICWYSELVTDEKVTQLITQTVICFLEADFQQLKQSLLDRCRMRQTSLTTYLHDCARKEQNDIIDYIEQSTNALQRVPQNTEELRSQVELCSSCKQQVSALRGKIQPIQAQFATLRELRVNVLEEEEALLGKLSPAIDCFEDALEAAEAMLIRTKKAMKLDAELLVDSISRRASELFKHFMTSAPFDGSPFNYDTATAFSIIQSYDAELNKLTESRRELDPILDFFGIDSLPNRDLGQMKSDSNKLSELWTLKAIRDRHWDRIKAEVAERFEHRSAEFTLKSVFCYDLIRRSDLVARLTEEARKEYKIEQALNNIVVVWSSLNLKIVPYKINLLHVEADESLVATLEEHLLCLSSIKSDQFHLPFKEIVHHWESTLSIVSELLELLQQVQRQWAYLENVFRGSEDIRILLPQEATLFDRTDRHFLKTLRGFQQAPMLVDVCTQPQIKEELQLMNDDLEDIKKSLDDYLERKRQEFPRFYFVSNTDMLEILGDAKDPERVQKHIKKFFQGIRSLDLVAPGKRGNRWCEADGFTSSEGERVRFTPRPVTLEGSVEQWLNKVTRAMRETLKRQLVAVHQQSMVTGTKREKWIQDNCFQLVIASAQITWATETECALRRLSKGNKNSMKMLRRHQSRQLMQLTDLLRKVPSNKERLKLNSLITVEVHNRDIHEKLIQSHCDGEHHFAWTSQLRLELREEKGEPEKSSFMASSSQTGFSGALHCQCLQAETVLAYGYEYQGIYRRLVITPLTDQCFMALTFALYLRLGGSCHGPAGTGKTETVKDLGKTLAKFVIVFNCSDALDYLSLGRIFSGLAQSGAWCCFDEFNRIGLEVLSVVAQQIATIQAALREIASDEHTPHKFCFEGQRVRLDPGCGIFTTMNPVYKGRADLPDSLKSLFRPVAMMSPDLALICEILLLAEGFDIARSLSRKVVALFQLMAQQLSKQDHYDFGLRPLCTALQRAGEFKRQAHESTTEQALMIQAIFDTVVPKTVPEDLDILFALLKDIFPESELQARESEELREALEEVIRKNGWTKVEDQIKKAQELFYCMRSRHGNMLVGNTLSGKSTVLSLLEEALNHLSAQGLDYFTIKSFFVNPKSLDEAELYGGFSSVTREWTDGIFSSLLRMCCNEVQGQSKCNRWVVLDGPVDTTWVEHMNSLLDDNKTLTLTNGDRMELHSQVSLLFETENLSVASPATVSRVGIIFMDSTKLGWAPCVDAWVSKRYGTSDAASYLRSLFNKYLPSMLQTIKECEQVVGISEMGAVHSLCRVFEVLASQPNVNIEVHGGQPLLEKVFLFSLIWSLGAAVGGGSRQQVDAAIRQLSSSFPPSHSVYDYALSTEKGDWTLWEDRVPSAYRPLDGTPFHRIFVPTADIMCHAFLLSGFVRNKIHGLVVGSRGCGKTSCIRRAVLDDLPESIYNTTTLTFSSQTSSNDAQEGFESKLEKRVKGKWGPPGRKTLVCFIDDLNMPKPDEFGSQPPLELLRHFLDYGSWYDRDRQSLKVVLDMQFLAAMGAPQEGYASIASRLQSRFNTIAFLEPSLSQVIRIYQTLVLHKFSDFKEDVKSIAESIATASIAVHYTVRQTFRPKPEKPHYLFTMREISKVVQGLYQADRRCIEDGDVLLKLWYHECQRVYQDRLASSEDVARFVETLENILGKSFQIRTKDLTKNRKIIFSHIRAQQSRVLAPGAYEEVQDWQALQTSLQLKLDEINATSTTGILNLVLFRGHMLLVGVGGSGRQSLASFATKLLEMNLCHLRVTRTYTIRDFHEELKHLIVKAGLDGICTSLLLTDKELKSEAFSDSLNSLLASGKIPGILDPESLAQLLKDLQPAAEAARVSSQPDALLEFFQTRVRENLHVLLCVSPIGNKIRDYCRMFPAFINETLVDWFFAWPQEALEEVATVLLEPADLDPASRDAVARATGRVHMDAIKVARTFYQKTKRTTSITPTKFLQLVGGYCNMLKEKQEGVREKISKIATGLSKLVEAREQVEAMSEALEAKKEHVAKMQRECDELMAIIVEKRTLADKQMKQVEADSARIQAEEVETKILSEDARRDLDKAMPALEAAIDALEKLDKKSVAEVKAYTKPPDLVVKTMAAVMTVMEKSPTWSQAKSELNDPSFLGRVKNFDKDSITNATLKKIEKFTKDPSFAPPNVQKVSRAAGALCLWVHAMQMYAEVYREVEPKRLKLRLAEEQLSKKQNDLKLSRDRLDDIQARLQQLNHQHDESLRNKSNLNNSAEELSLKLGRAENLITGLADERDRWELSLGSYRTNLSNILGDALLGAAFMSYAGPFTASYRAQLVKDLWTCELRGLDLPCSTDFNFTEFLVSPLDVREWQLNGLPTDSFSTENGVLMMNAPKWPLVIDPQNQANRWIRKLKSSEIKVIDPASKDLLRILHLSIQAGHSLLLERLQTQIDPSLEPLITKNVTVVNGSKFIRIGDQLVPYENNFSLWMTTKLGNPQFPAEIETEVTLINFVIMQDGLTEQLLGVVVMKEEPSLEAHKHALVSRLAEGRKRLQDVEDQILRLLTTARGCLLDDLELIEALQNSKRVAADVSSQIDTSEHTMKKIDQAREAYRPCGHRASVLYFVLQDLASVNSMYQFSLEAYEGLFVESISKAKECTGMAASAEEHVMTINSDHTHAVFRHARQGVFERHKALLGLHLCASILLADDQLNRHEYAFLFTRGALLDAPSPPTNPDPEWITPAAWQLVCKADQLEALQGLQSSVDQNSREWRRWFGSTEPERATLPGDWQARLDALQRLIVIRCLRPDRVIPAASRFVADALDARFIENMPLDWEDLFASSKNTVPLLLLLSGVDPVGQLMTFATSKNATVVSVALGQGQAMRAEQAIRDGARHGFWVFLANCHLAVSWLPTLEKLTEEILNMKLHPNFRLWLSSEPTENFPIALLQRSTKVTIERPRGLRANLQRLLQHRTEEDMQRVHGAAERYQRLFLSLCWFHSLLIERGKFHNTGWTRDASFSDSDFFVGDSIIATYCEQSPSEFPWEAARSRIVGACYGGRLTDERDLRLLRVYCNDCFNPQVLTRDFRFQGLSQLPLPDDISLNGLRQYARDLPAIDSPEIFGQHINAEIYSQIEEAEELFTTLLNIQAPGADEFESGEGKCRDTMEAQRLNRLLSCAKEMVQNLRKAISGFCTMSDDLETLQSSLLRGEVPHSWSFAFPSLKPLMSWTNDLAEREGQPKVFWLGGLTYPSAFLAALLQQFARKNSVPVDTISFEFIAQTAYDEGLLPSPPREGAYVKRLYLEGASWNLEGMALKEPEPMQLICELPIVHLKPTTRRRNLTEKLYMCPIYQYPCRKGTIDRPSLVTMQEIRSGAQDPSFWVKRGTAILLSTAT
ncbi:heavy chain 2 family protein [Cyclospora cayetanensis]|uniref:Heavy chain 2 family protein n=1 Tax=Cyclospora cayetanensis TaxID=88456 RepID=A0A1D3D7R2_9EIME|nr:heavy chain 2 family protein [Cyclospora cayetanensis]